MRKNFVAFGDAETLISKIKSDYLSKGEVPYTASRVEQGYVEDTFSANGSGSASVTFTSPMPDSDYIVVTDCDRVGVEVAIINKSVNGFTLVVSNNNTSDLTLRVDYTAFELFELTTLAEIESDVQTRLKIVFNMADIESPAENQTVLYMGETTTTEPIYKQGGIYEYDGTKWTLKSADNITFDDELSLDSENGVQNKVVTQAVNKRLLVTDTMEAATAELEGATRLYIGTSDDYTKGGIYECVETSTGVFEWVERNKADVDLTFYKKIFNGTQATWDSLTLKEKVEFDLCVITDDYNESEEIEDITSQLTFHTENITGGNVYVNKYGKIVQVDVHSVKVSAYSKDIISGLPKPIRNHGNTFPAQGDGNPQILGLFMVSADGVLSSGTQSAGLAPNIVWDATFCYLTED